VARPRVKLKADCASDAGGNVITIHKDCSAPIAIIRVSGSEP